jgi:hypothetical protein
MADDTKNPALTNVTPWGLHPVPGFVRDTLKKRPKSYAWHSSTEKDTGAVRTAWARVCSNGRTPSHNNLEGFILFGPNTDTSSGPIGFNESFGFGSDGKQVIGRDANNSPHTLSPVTFPHRPPPAMLSIETEFYGAGSSFPGLCKKSTIKWKCFSKEQLEYITPYFLSLSVTVVIEWGWNNYSAKSLINLADKTELLQMFSAGKSYYNRIVDSGGDYDCHVGRIIDYGYTMDNRGNYEGYTVVVNPSFMMEGVNIKDQTGVTDDKNSASCAVDFIKNRFDNLATTKDKLITQFYGKEFQLAWLINRNNWIFVRPDEKFPEIKPDAKFWINMRGLQAIFNLFGSIKYGGRHVDLTFRFANAKIGAHPLIKAVCAGSDNKNVSVLIPNANAPRLMRKATDKASKQSLKSVTDPNADPRWKNTVSSLSNAMSEQFKFTDETDNLKSAINSANPFPMLVGGGYIPNDDPALGKGPVTGSISGIDPIYNAAKPGYWGFLGDIYVSNTLVKTAFTQNDTLQRALEYILGEISSAGSNFWEFRVIPEAPNNITVIDSSFCPVTSGPEADNENIVNFEIGRTEDSCFTTYGMSVQMKQEMATQTLLGNNSSVDAKGQMVSAFTSGDRLFMTSGSFDYVAESEDEKTDKAKQTEATDKAVDVYNKGRETDKGCVIWQRGDDKYYLVEKDPEVMKKIVALGERPGTSAKPLSTPMMPGKEFTFECPGTSGFAFLRMCTLSSVPTPYDREHAVFQVDGVKNVIAENNWKTSITAKVRPLLSTGAANK